MKKHYAYTVKNDQPQWRQLYLAFYSFCLFTSFFLSNTAHAVIPASETTNGSLSIWIGAPETGNILDCYTKEVKIDTYVTKDGVPVTGSLTYSWTGPDGFTSDSKYITVTVPGLYRLTTRSETGEYGNNWITVYGDNYPASFAGADTKMYPSTETVTLGGYAHGLNGTVHENYTVSWEASNGGNILSGANTLKPVVDAPGTYTITLTHKLSGCTMQDDMIVTYEEISASSLEASIPDMEPPFLDCNNPSIHLYGLAKLNGEVQYEGITYSWTGPDNFAAETQDIAAEVPGEYTLTVTHTASGYSASASQTVYPPTYPTGSAGPDKKLTCDNPTVMLEGTMTLGNRVVWRASDGGNIVSGHESLNPIVDAPGTYTLTIHFYAMACTSEYEVKVTNEKELKITATGGKLDCASGSIQLTASPDKEGINYSWTGPNGYTSSEQNPAVTVAGEYLVTATNPESGCSASTSVVVTPSSTELTVKAYLIDFNSEKKGLISSIETDAGPVSIMGRKRNFTGSTSLDFYAPENHAAIFDSQAPTGDDADLYTTDWGNVLIINRDLTDTPDDNEWGGELILDFSEIGPVTLESLGLLDLDHYEDMSWVYLYDEAGNELHKIHLKTLGNNSRQTVDLGNTRGVTKLKVILDGRNGLGQLAGSGAIDDVKFRVETAVASPCENAEQQEALQALAYPTTFSDKATVQFTLQDAGEYTVNLYDTQGNLVKQLKEGTAMANEQVTVEVLAGNLKEGMYLTRIMTSAGSKTLKLILKR